MMTFLTLNLGISRASWKFQKYESYFTTRKSPLFPTIFLEDKNSFMTTNVSQIRATGSENCPIHSHFTCIRYQDFSALLIQIAVFFNFSLIIRSLVVSTKLGTGGCINAYLFLHP